MWKSGETIAYSGTQKWGGPASWSLFLLGAGEQELHGGIVMWRGARHAGTMRGEGEGGVDCLEARLI